MPATLFAQHINRLQQLYETALSRPESGIFDAVLIHSGSERHYFADDRGIPFQAFGHFCHWLPVNRPDQFLLIRSGKPPLYLQVIVQDFWHDQTIVNEPWWGEAFEIRQLATVSELAGHLPAGRTAYLGESNALAQTLKLEHDSEAVTQLWRYLDFQRAQKTPYEIEQLTEAARIALLGHAAARDCFLDGGSEYDIHMAYLLACRALENETPYTGIVAVNEKAAILHYQQKRVTAQPDNKVLLIDAGYRLHNYGSDITRTVISDNAHPVFAALLNGMEQLQQNIVASVKPGIPYPQLHQQTLQEMAQLLSDLDICRGPAEDLLAQQLPQLFMPHGVGHLLGIQVHDVGGHQRDESGNRVPPPEHSPALRNTRMVAENQVFTIEPGCYFIPMLLEPERNSRRGQAINWTLLEQLYCHGGIRIEDNVLVTSNGQRNLSRP